MNFLKKILFTLACIFLSPNIFSQNISTEDYIQQYKKLAIIEMQRTGVPAAITLAQGILESGSGNSRLALISNNHFGIKCKTEWTGNRVFYDDDEKGECFRKYNSVEDSYIDHSNFLKTREHYAFLFSLEPSNYKAWAEGLKKAGYATSNKYPAQLIKVIEENNLQQYSFHSFKINNDSLETNARNKQIELINKIDSSIVIVHQENIQQEESDSINETETEIFNESKDSSSNSVYPKELFVLNNTKVLFFKKGVSLLAIANKYNISLKNILDFNHLENVEILNQEQLIFLERKPKKGMTDFHIVKENESLYHISQIEAIRLESILEYNKISKNEIPEIGEKLFLKSASLKKPKLKNQESSTIK